MRKKIFAGIAGVSLIIMIICTCLVTGILYDYMGVKLDGELADEAVLVEQGWLSGGEDYLEKLEERRNIGSRITLLSSSGDVLYDSAADTHKMENHMQREEVKDAMEKGEGFATRVSYTLAQDMRYYAKKTEDGNIIRVSMSHSSRMRLILDTAGTFTATLAVLIVLALIISFKTAKAIIKPINDINLDNPEISESYDELAPLLGRIRTQNESIRRQMEKLRKRREEFNIITENMSEGLLVIDKDTEILTYNSTALTMLSDEREYAEATAGTGAGGGADAVGAGADGGVDAVTVGAAEGGVDADGVEKYSNSVRPGKTEGSVFRLNRSEPFRSAVNEALGGSHAQTYIRSENATYELIASPVKDRGEVTGAILIIMDATQRERGERMRREFTSNVSHELKTPLTSIYGISDMLASGMVKPEDVQGFAKTIKEESARLISLIEDIMKLSRLDENAGGDTGEVADLWDIASQTVQRLTSKADKNEVKLELKGGKALVKGPDYIVDEIVYNLCENAIKYNKKGGSVRVSVDDEAGRCILTVQDTGMGIPKGEEERVFERFYRVDKSHSKKIGGTGLGLSIVKHGVAFLGGTISLESEEGKGTTVTVVFQKYA